jgi:hypothetical protein
MQDVWTALAHGRPLHIHEDDWAIQDLTQYDFEAEDENVEGSLFMCMTSLTKIQYDVLKQFYSVKSSMLQDTVQLFAKARPMLIALNEWYAGLPPNLTMASMPSRQLCSNGKHYNPASVTLLILYIRKCSPCILCYKD